MFAHKGIRVTGVDNNPQVIDSLRQGKVHIFEPGLNELVKEVFENGRLEVSDQPVEADAFIIAVPTPFMMKKKLIFALSELQQNPSSRYCEQGTWWCSNPPLRH